MKKCNVSVSTAKKGEVLQAIGIGICQITVVTSNGELTKLVLHDVLYVQELRSNLLSTSKLSQDRFQVVFPAKDSIFSPGIYNCSKHKSSVEQSFRLLKWETYSMFIHALKQRSSVMIEQRRSGSYGIIVWDICHSTRSNKWSTAVRDLMTFKES